ncbi:alpha/beta hydrolase fold domain-containing protein [uncultured Jatrophihabitans sp.]|uniref:alpha/beta hydrolase fold domain-containing protein n=1 Tax=uncultured Jatrophihabitans sp. TaxID=1610747 RepID=UPI0035CB925C
MSDIDVRRDVDVRRDTDVRRDVVYAAPVGYRPLALDLYLPPRPTALCVYLHGGGWRVGSRRAGPGAAAKWTAPSFFERVAAEGLAVASVDYRLSGEAVFPAQADDVRAARRFLADHADEFGLPSASTVWGVSAGGQLAALAALEQPSTDVPPALAAVCWYTPSDLDALSADVAEAGGEPDRSAASREGMLVGGALADQPELVSAASAVAQVPTDRQPPPFLFLHGDADRSVPPRQSTRLADALRAAGGAATVELVPGGTHMFPELDDDATLSLVRRSTQFLLDAVG